MTKTPHVEEDGAFIHYKTEHRALPPLGRATRSWHVGAVLAGRGPACSYQARKFLTNACCLVQLVVNVRDCTTAATRVRPVLSAVQARRTRYSTGSCATSSPAMVTSCTRSTTTASCAWTWTQARCVRGPSSVMNFHQVPSSARAQLSHLDADMMLLWNSTFGVHSRNRTPSLHVATLKALERACT